MQQRGLSSRRAFLSHVKLPRTCRRKLRVSSQCSSQGNKPTAEPVMASSAFLDAAHAPTASAIPTPAEDKEVMHNAYLHAFETAQPEKAHIPGMMEFAGAILARSQIPSQQYNDPLMHIFDEVDADGDGSLSAHEVAEALRSRDVRITDEEAAMFIDVVDLNHSHKVERSEFRDLILHMAAADLHMRRQGADNTSGYVMCSWERDDEIQARLKSWTDSLLARQIQT